MKRNFLVAAFALALCAATASATTLLPLDVRQLTQESNSVVIGRIAAVAELSGEPGVALQEVTVEVSETLKGDLAGTVVVSNPGFDGAPAFGPGDEAVLFIYSKDGVNVLTGLQQGRFGILTDAKGARTLDRPIPSRDKATAGSTSLEALVGEVLAAQQ